MDDLRMPTWTSDPVPKKPDRFMSLRTKFVIFFSLILITACSALTLYFIESRRASTADNLQRLGSILLTSLVNNGQFRYGALIAEDRATLQQFTESLIAVDDVVYVVIRGADGQILAQQNKLVRKSGGNSLTFHQERRYYPDERIAQALYREPVTSPLMTPVALSEDKVLMPTDLSSEWSWLPFQLHEHILDFALPVIRKAATDPSLTRLPLELEESGPPSKLPVRDTVQGVVQIGISDAQVTRALLPIIRNAILLTMLIIVAGILGAHFMTQRITTPIRKLAGVAKQLAEGATPEPLTPAAHDEVGQLTNMFNEMSRSLEERSRAITLNLETIRKQVGQLTTVHQTSAAISSTLDLDQLMNTILKLLITNLGLSRMMLLLKREDSNVVDVAQIEGVSQHVAEAALGIHLPFREDNSLLAELFIQAKPVLVSRLEDVAHRMQPPMLELGRRVGVISFVAVPLQSHSHVLGVLVGDRGSQPCTTDDLEILTTIASHVATAIDNARAYGRLARLTESLEQRIQDRTRELSAANEQLQEHDKRRTMFVSVASHELRTPMTVIRSFADNMLDGVAGALTERQKVYLTRIGHNLNRLTRIINQLLDWSRLDLKKEELHLEPVALEKLAGVVMESLRMVADEKRISLSLTASDGLPPVMGDRDRLEQVLWNLIGNALKFTDPNGSVTVTVEQTADRMVQTCVADTGCGIPAQHLGNVFNEFSKVPSTIPGSQGAQLGLFITKTFIGMHKGRIWVESVEGQGTKFFFTLPCAPDSDGTSPKK